MPDKTIHLDKTGEWSPAAVQALIERLYETRRCCNAINISNPVFVLPCRNEEARHQLEDAIYRYYLQKFGSSMAVKDSMLHGGDTILHFEFGVSIVLMNV